MVIKRKDGTIYQLRGPNPVMKTQKEWDNFTLHNFKWTSEIQIPNNKKNIPLHSDFQIKEPTLEPEQNLKTKIHCLPTIVKQNTDSIYGESRPTLEYGEKIIFEGIITNQNDFVIQFLTNLDLENNSIIYPVNKDKRWWKINKKEEKDSAFLYTAIFSEIHPDFT